MRLDIVRMACLPRLEVEIDLEPRLLLATGIGDVDLDGAFAILASVAIRSAKERDQALAGFWVNLNPHSFPSPHCE